MSGQTTTIGPERSISEHAIICIKFHILFLATILILDI